MADLVDLDVPLTGANPLSAFPATGLWPTHRPLHALDSTVGSAWRGLTQCCCGQTAAPFDRLRPPGAGPYDDDPGDLRRIDSDNIGKDNLPNLAKATPPKMRSRETWRDLEQLPLDYAEDVKRYFYCTDLAHGPSVKDSNDTLQNLKKIAPGTRDAFGSVTFDLDGEKRRLLPRSVLKSPLVNAAAKDFQDELKESAPNKGPGHASKEVMTQLCDTYNGFSAGITFDRDKREMVIAFSGVGSAKRKWTQYFHTCVPNWLGLIPKSMRQASELTQHVKQHIQELNRDLPPEKQIKLTLTGHSMGGGLASYAALRNEVPAVVFNPMRLGSGARARIGQHRLAEADKYLTEVVTEGDWVADNDWSKLYILPSLGSLAFSMRGPLGNARRYMLPSFALNRDDRHHNIAQLIQRMEDQREWLQQHVPNLYPLLKETSPRARGRANGGNVESAVAEALTKELKSVGYAISKAQRRSIARLTQELISGKRNGQPLEDVNKTQNELRQELAKIRNAVKRPKPKQHVPEPKPLRVIDAIQNDLVEKTLDVRKDLKQKQAEDRLSAIKKKYYVGGEESDFILNKIGINKNQIDIAHLNNSIDKYFDKTFGEDGSKIYVTYDKRKNYDRADKAFSKALWWTLCEQLEQNPPYDKPPYTDPNMQPFSESELEKLGSKALAWSQFGVPEPDDDKEEEEENNRDDGIQIAAADDT